MGKIYENILGTAKIEICGTHPEAFMNACAINGIELWKLECIDEFTVSLWAYEKDMAIIESIAQRAMCAFKTLEISGGSKNKSFLKRRKLLLVFILLFAVLLAVSSLFIWEIDVYGNNELTKSEIIRELANCGIGEGTYWPGISAEMVRSKMLIRLPELSWMTVNISGSRASVLVQERKAKPEIYVESKAAHIVAAESGIIKSVSVSEGRNQIHKGQTVSKGQLLVSGVMDSISGDSRLVRSKANIIADTCREINMIYPNKMRSKISSNRTKLRFAVKFAKKRINFYLNGRNNVDECDKIITEYKLGFDGLFALPISVITEKILPYKGQEFKTDISELICSQQLGRLSENLKGNVEYSSFSEAENGGLTYVTLYAQCREDIAKTVEIQ